MPLTRLIYASLREDRGEEDLADILESSGRRNAAAGLTGALVAGERHFLQLLEGRRGDVGRCLARIGRDRRHGDVQVVSAGEVRHRLFPMWSMRLVDDPLARRLAPQLDALADVTPQQMSQSAAEDLFRRLAVELCEATALDPPPPVPPEVHA